MNRGIVKKGMGTSTLLLPQRREWAHLALRPVIQWQFDASSHPKLRKRVPPGTLLKKGIGIPIVATSTYSETALVSIPPPPLSHSGPFWVRASTYSETVSTKENEPIKPMATPARDRLRRFRARVRAR